METFNYCGPGNVVLDSCNECKLTWFNQGELGKIIRAPGRRKLPTEADKLMPLTGTNFYTEQMFDVIDSFTRPGGTWRLG